MNFTQYFTGSHFSLQTIFLKFGDKIPVLLISQSVDKCLPYIIFGLYFQEICWSINDHLNIPTIRTRKYGRFSVRASTLYLWNSIKIY